ncbi:hypothetical protein [Streptomyces sp. NPDC051286]|uniref:hypothetical protein n=1 Tax=Streptomyces sp. NPDC051286 TaxID=3365647 RepID=UPI0037AC786E
MRGRIGTDLHEAAGPLAAEGVPDGPDQTGAAEVIKAGAAHGLVNRLSQDLDVAPENPEQMRQVRALFTTQARTVPPSTQVRHRRPSSQDDQRSNEGWSVLAQPGPARVRGPAPRWLDISLAPAAGVRAR